MSVIQGGLGRLGVGTTHYPPPHLYYSLLFYWFLTLCVCVSYIENQNALFAPFFFSFKKNVDTQTHTHTDIYTFSFFLLQLLCLWLIVFFLNIRVFHEEIIFYKTITKFWFFKEVHDFKISLSGAVFFSFEPFPLTPPLPHIHFWVP